MIALRSIIAAKLGVMSMELGPWRMLRLFSLVFLVSGCSVSIADVKFIEPNKYEVFAHGNKVTSKTQLVERIESEAKVICKDKPYKIYGENNVLKTTNGSLKGANKILVKIVICK